MISALIESCSLVCFSLLLLPSTLSSRSPVPRSYHHLSTVFIIVLRRIITITIIIFMSMYMRVYICLPCFHFPKQISVKANTLTANTQTLHLPSFFCCFNAWSHQFHNSPTCFAMSVDLTESADIVMLLLDCVVCSTLAFSCHWMFHLAYVTIDINTHSLTIIVGLVMMVEDVDADNINAGRHLCRHPPFYICCILIQSVTKHLLLDLFLCYLDNIKQQTSFLETHRIRFKNILSKFWRCYGCL